MITPRNANSEEDDDEDNQLSFSASSIEDIQFWIDHPSLDDLTATQTEPDRQQVRRDVEDCIRLFSAPVHRLGPETDDNKQDSKAQPLLRIRYTVLKLLGVGAFGVVLLARDRLLNREVAIKVLRPSVLLSKQARTRFSMEGEALARCNCEGVVPIHEVGQIDGNPYLVMGHIQGITLAEYLKSQESPVATTIAVRIVAAIALAVHRAHQRGILHRDLKPSNVLLEKTDDERFRLPFNLFVSDFGLAKDLLPDSDGSPGDRSMDSPIVGTVRYMSPEQATGQNSDVSTTSDVFSLGVILYELLTLQCPFSGSTTFEIIRQVATGQAKSPRQLNPKVSRELNAIVGRCLAKSPSERYQSASELSEDLHRFLDGKPVVAKPAGPIKATLFWARRNPSLAIASGIIWLGLVFGTIAMSLLYRENLKNLRAAQEANIQIEASRKFTLRAVDSSFRYTAEKLLQNQPQSHFLQLQLHQKALQTYTEIAEQRGYDEESTYRLSFAHHYIANDALNCQDFELASIHRERCLEIVEKLAAQNPKNGHYQFDLFMNRLKTQKGKMSDEAYLAWQLKAREHLLAAISLLPYNPDFVDADAAICYQLAFLDPIHSGEWVGNAIRLSSEIGIKYPEKPHYFKYAIAGLNMLAREAVKASKWVEACKHAEEALDLIDKHYRKSHSNADIETAIIEALQYQAQALGHLDIAKALKIYDQLIVATGALEKRDKKYEFYRMNVADAHLSQAKLHYQIGDRSTSQALFTKASTLLEDYVPKFDSHASILSDVQSRIAEFEVTLKPK